MQNPSRYRVCIPGASGELLSRRLRSSALRASVAVLSGVLLSSAAAHARSTMAPRHLSAAEANQVTVWAIPSSKVYHCPGSRWYERAEGGTLMPECEALGQGFRPAFGVGCGSACKK
jgi:hypothetical protein